MLKCSISNAIIRKDAVVLFTVPTNFYVHSKGAILNNTDDFLPICMPFKLVREKDYEWYFSEKEEDVIYNKVSINYFEEIFKGYVEENGYLSEKDSTILNKIMNNTYYKNEDYSWLNRSDSSEDTVLEILSTILDGNLRGLSTTIIDRKVYDKMMEGTYNINTYLEMAKKELREYKENKNVYVSSFSDISGGLSGHVGMGKVRLNYLDMLESNIENISFMEQLTEAYRFIIKMYNAKIPYHKPVFVNSRNVDLQTVGKVLEGQLDSLKEYLIENSNLLYDYDYNVEDIKSFGKEELITFLVNINHKSNS